MALYETDWLLGLLNDNYPSLLSSMMPFLYPHSHLL